MSWGLEDACFVEVEGLTKIYSNGTVALRGISFRLERPGVVGVIGPNGAGKTTLVRILSGQLKPTSGVARVLGLRVDTEERRVKERIAVLPQDVRPHFFLLTPLEYVYYYLRLRGLGRREALERARRAVEELGIDYWDQVVVNLSPGMARRAMLAMVLAYDAEVYFLDEPTAGLDPVARRSVWSALRRRARSSLVLVTSHHMDEVSRLCDHVLLIDSGRLVAEGSPETLAEKLLPGLRWRIVVVGETRPPTGVARVVGRYTYIYASSKSERDEIIAWLSEAGLLFRVEETSIEDYFVLRGAV